MTLTERVLRKLSIDNELLEHWLERHNMKENDLTKVYVRNIWWTILSIAVSLVGVTCFITILLYDPGSGSSYRWVTPVSAIATLFLFLFILIPYVSLQSTRNVLGALVKKVSDLRRICKCEEDTPHLLTAVHVRRVLRKRLVRIAREKLQEEVVMREGKKHGMARVSNAGTEWRRLTNEWSSFYEIAYHFGIEDGKDEIFELARIELSPEERRILDS